MKKLLVLMLTLGALTTAFAQSGRHQNRYPYDNGKDVVLGPQNDRNWDNDRRDDDAYTFTARERDEQIRQINREFAWKIQAVKRDRYLRSWEKSRRIHMLEMQRDREIQEVKERYARSNNRYSKSYPRRW